MPNVPLGLTSAQARSRLAEFGPNILAPQAHSVGPLTWLLHLFADPMSLLLLVAGVTYAIVGDRLDAAITLGALIPIFLVSALLESRSDRALEALRKLAEPNARVYRDGLLVTIPAQELVIGDLIVVQEGDIMPVDGDIVDGARLVLDESALTGESLPLTKGSAGSSGSHILAGTTLLAGHGAIAVTATGTATEYGRIGSVMAGIGKTVTPIERAIRRLVVQIGIGVAVVCAAVLAIDRFHGDAWPIAIIAAVSLAMAAIPEELPMVYTLYMALGAWRLARDNALVRGLSSVETLGATSVLCVDKTGTLTFGQLGVAAWSPHANIAQLSLAESAVLACESDAFDPLDKAIVRAANELGVDTAALRSRSAIDDYPFDANTRYATKVWLHSGLMSIAAKGAVEDIVSRCPLSEDERAQIARRNEALAREGMRVIAVAGGIVHDSTHDRERDERALRFLGLVALADRVRPQAIGALEEFRSAGIRVVMITGDHPVTAAAVARSLGIQAPESSVVTGDVLAASSDSQVAVLVASSQVFARIRPEQKLRIVRALRAAGAVVAMTGDGTNDALALREADIGVAMGARGTEVARNAANLVLLDDNINTIVRAVRDGRRIFHNLRHAFRYLNGFHAPLLLCALVVPLTGLPLLLLPIHLVWLEIIVHPTSSLVFESDPIDEDVMRRPPRDPNAPLLGLRDWSRPLLAGFTLSAAVLGLYWWTIAHALPVNEARAIAIVAMITGQLLMVLQERSGDKPLWQTSIADNPILVWILGGTALSVGVAVYVAPLAAVLKLQPPEPALMLLAVAAGLATTLWVEPLKAWEYAKRERSVT